LGENVIIEKRKGGIMGKTGENINGGGEQREIRLKKKIKRKWEGK
jgi:hypothetical protein